MEAITLFQTSSQSFFFIRSYEPPKSWEVQFREFRDSQLGSLGTKWHLGFGPVAIHRKYYKGGRWWFPPSPGRGEFCEFVFARGSFMHQKCSNYALTNLLFGLWKFTWIVNLLITCSSPHPETTTRSSTLEVLRIRKCALTPYLSIVFTLDSHLNLSRSLGVHKK
jgi:hypothetical protein